MSHYFLLRSINIVLIDVDAPTCSKTLETVCGKGNGGMRPGLW